MNASTDSGWYPNPDGSPNQRRWDGKEWTTETRPYPSPNPTDDATNNVGEDTPSPSSVRRLELGTRIPRTGWIVILSVLIIFILATVLPAVSAGSGNGNSSAQDEVAATKPSSQPEAEAIKPTPAGPVLIPLGSPIVSPNFSLVIDSVELLDQIETNSGGPIVAEPGTRLVLVRSTISVTGSAIDLACASAAAIFIQAYDSNKSQMAPIFEGPRIPGNPECNYKTSAGETVSWNFAYKIAADRTPLLMSVIDTNVAGAWGPEQFASLQ